MLMLIQSPKNQLKIPNKDN